MRSSRLLLVLFLSLFAVGAGGCRVYLVPAGEAEPAPGNVEDAEAPEEDDGTDSATTGEETEDDVEPAVRDRDEDDEADGSTPPTPRERPSADRGDREDAASGDGEAGEEEDADGTTSGARSRERADRETADDSDPVPPQPRERPTDRSDGEAGDDPASGEDAEADDPPADDEDEARDDDGLDREEARREGRRRARRRAGRLRIPPGHYPPEGRCRLWHAGRPPGQQPPPAPCSELADEELGSGVFVLYGGVAWDGSYDWEAVEMEHPGAVPRPVLMLVGSGDGGSR